ncbi:catalytic subunit of the PKA [Diplocarpon rosae]|nr:catalytic subunit of the PKA [Diplocarpon rosae]
MTQGVSHQQQQGYGTYSQPAAALGQQNLPSINNLINPPQNDGATQSKPNMGQGEPENGAARQHGKLFRDF